MEPGTLAQLQAMHTLQGMGGIQVCVMCMCHVPLHLHLCCVCMRGYFALICCDVVVFVAGKQCIVHCAPLVHELGVPSSMSNLVVHHMGSQEAGPSSMSNLVVHYMGSQEAEQN